MTEEGLEIFSLVAECGSNSEAARILNISQSSVSRAISRLGAGFNTKLLNRDSTPFTLTKSGAFLKNQIDRGMSMSQQLSRFIQEQDTAQVKIGYTFPVSCHLISKYLTALKMYCPEIKITALLEDKYLIRYYLSEGQLDFAVIPDKFNLSEYRIMDVIEDFDWCFAAPSGVPVTRNKYVEPEDIAGLPILLPTEITCSDAITGWYGDRNTISNPDSYNSTGTLKELIKGGCGYGFIPRAEQDHLETKDTSVYVCYPRIVTTIYIYTRKNINTNEALRKCMNLYKTKFK